VVSAITHTPASGPFELVTTPPMLSAPTETELATACAAALDRDAASILAITEAVTALQAINDKIVPRTQPIRITPPVTIMAPNSFERMLRRSLDSSQKAQNRLIDFDFA
jgi:hypothetical protein